MAKRQRSELSKQKSRISKIVKGAKSRGYIFTGGDVFKYLPTDAAQLKQVKSEQIYSLAVYVEEASGNVISGTARRAQERSIAAKKAYYTRRASQIDQAILPSEIDDVIANAMELLKRMQDEIKNWENSSYVTSHRDEWGYLSSRKSSKTFYQVKEQDKNTLASFFQATINELGLQTVARNLQRNAAAAQGYLEAILYGGSGATRDGGNYAQAELTSFLAIARTGRADGIVAADLAALEPALEANEEI